MLKNGLIAIHNSLFNSEMCKLSQLSSCNESLEGASLRVHSLQDFEDSCDSLGVLALLINPGW